MKIKQHIPGWAQHDPSTDEHKEAEFKTLAELQQVDFVKSFCDKPNFVRLSRTEIHVYFTSEENRPLEDEYYCNLMVELDGDPAWWVLGTIDGTVGELLSLELPAWVAKKEEPVKVEPVPVVDDQPTPTVDELIAAGGLSFVTRDVQENELSPKPVEKLYPTAGELWSDGDVDLLTVLSAEGDIIAFTRTSGPDGRLDVSKRETATLDKFKEILADKHLGASNDYTVGYLHESGD